jgi:hypothetical protein
MLGKKYVVLYKQISRKFLWEGQMDGGEEQMEPGPSQ